MNSVERMKYYAENVVQEDPEEEEGGNRRALVDPKNLPEHWPATGQNYDPLCMFVCVYKFYLSYMYYVYHMHI